ncbi:MAG: SGNH/GDSL hydrolase family protein [Chloracidobacterium sp.]|nr:SGNH/GDSL hydrolase family protein [Chloracidobacterium sp.]
MKHIVLLGDSVFDNKAYVNAGLDVIEQVRRRVPDGWKVSLRAVDGSVVENVREQTLDLPDGATDLVVSVGGNDAILNAGILQRQVESSAEVLNELAVISSEFESRYSEMLQGVLRLKKSAAVCTIYNPRISDPFTQKIAVAALSTFNDVITRRAFLAGVPLIDLRLVCDEDSDYANEIEPSEKGGGKIASAIVRLVSEHNFEIRRTEVFF